jgi:hypothetical protein
MTPETLVTATRDRVAQVLRDRYPSAEDFGDGSYTLSHGSSSVIIVVRPYTETDTMVEVTAQVVTGAGGRQGDGKPEERAVAVEGGAQFTDEIPPSDPKRHKHSPFSG